jgi:hypothetical protein
MRVNVRIYPSARRTEVGGRYGQADPPVLVVRISAPATDGRANEAVINAVAKAFGVNRSKVSLISGATSRHKVVEVVEADPGVLDQLLTG